MARAFRGLRSDPDSRYDAIVIGAGIGGLVCANLLAKAGLKTLLVEQHYMAGGYCSTFRRRGFTFDAGTHFYPLLGNPSTLTGKLLRDLDVPTQWIKMDPVDHFHFPDGSSFAVSADFDRYLADLKLAFPEESSSLDRFFDLAREAYLHGLLKYFRWRDSPKLARYGDLSLRDALQRFFKCKKLRLLLAADCPHWGSPPSRTSFVFDSMLRLSYFLGNYYPLGGSQRFADDLAAVFERRGGSVLMSSRVERILVEDGAAVGVAVRTGFGGKRREVRLASEVVVSNADLLLTFERLLGPEVVGRQAIDSLLSLKPSAPCYLTHVGLRGISTKKLMQIQGYYWDDWDPETVGREGLRFKLFFPTLYDPSLAKPGRHVMLVQKVREIDFEAVNDWVAHKREYEASIDSKLERTLPGISEHIEVQLSATADTFRRYTLNRAGAMLGWEMSPDQLGASRPGLEGPVGNLFCTGHWTQPGGGITPVMVSAIRVADMILKRSPNPPARERDGVFSDLHRGGLGRGRSFFRPA